MLAPDPFPKVQSWDRVLVNPVRPRRQIVLVLAEIIGLLLLIKEWKYRVLTTATPWKTQSNLNLILSQKFRRLFKAAEQASSTRDDYDTYILCMAWFAGILSVRSREVRASEGLCLLGWYWKRYCELLSSWKTIAHLNHLCRWYSHSHLDSRLNESRKAKDRTIIFIEPNL